MADVSNLTIQEIDIYKDNFGTTYSKTNENFRDIYKFLSNLGVDSKHESIVATEGQTEFSTTLGVFLPRTNTLRVVIDGLEQTAGTSYEEISNTTIRFSEPLARGQVVELYYQCVTAIISTYHTRERVTLDGGNFHDSIDTDTIIVDGGSFSDTTTTVYDGESFTRGVY